MKKAVRLVGFGVAGVFVLAIIAAGLLFLLGSRKINQVHTVKGKAVTVEANAETLARGEHLVRFVSGCAECHGSNLGGQVFLDDPSFATIYAPNLTTGKGGAASVYTGADWERALRHGIAHEGRALAAMMPSEAAQNLSDADLAAIVAYLKSALPVDATTPKPKYSLLARTLIGAGVVPLSPELVARTPRLEPSPATGVNAEYGRYLANIAGCTTCHGARLQGGTHPADPSLKTPNLSSGDAAAWRLADFRQALRTGRTPGGQVLDLELMPWPIYTGMTDDETEAIWLWLESLSREARAD